MVRFVLASIALVSCLTATVPASAQDAAASRAEQLFVDGRDARDRGDHATACSKFGESLALVKRASTLVNLAICAEKLGKLTAAMAYANEALAMLPATDERVATAKEVLERATQRVATVTLALPGGAPADVRVTVDGTAIAASALASPVTLDPGEHELLVSAAGRADAKQKVTLAEGQRMDVALAVGAPTPRAAPVPSDQPPSRRIAGDEFPRRTIGWVIGGVGVAGLVGAGVTGGILLANDATISDNCKNAVCNQDGLDAVESSDTLFIVNYVAWGVGIVGVGAGLVLVLTSPSGDVASASAARATTVSPWLSPEVAGFAVHRRF
jgi:hypothetical protein